MSKVKELEVQRKNKIKLVNKHMKNNSTPPGLSEIKVKYQYDTIHYLSH